MCEICRQSPCHAKCPNAEHIIWNMCDKCGDDLYKDETYWTDSEDNHFCSQECAIEYHEIEERE